jgi:cell division septum initiation protein DivIVA
MEVTMSVERPTTSAVLRPDGMNAGAVVRSDFSRVRRGGFDPDQVVEHLKRVANHIADLEASVADLEARLSERQAGPNEEAVRNEVYQKMGARVADLIRSFDEEMERVRANAYSEAENRLSEARAHAERIDRDAEKVRSEAERTADELLKGLESRRGAMLDDVRRIHEGLQRSAAIVASILQRELDVVVVDETTRPQP